MNALHRLFIPFALGCTASYAAPFLAIGESAELFLTAVTGVRFEDNTLLTENNEVDDIALQFTPGIELVFGKGSLVSGTFTIQESFTEYVDNDALGSNLTTFALNAAYAGSKLSSNFSASYREVEQNGRDITNAATLTRRDITSTSIDGEYALTEKTKLGAGFSYTGTRYDSPGFTDSDTYAVPVDYFFAITPKVDLSAGVRFRETKNSGAGDFTDTYYNVGARGEFTTKLSGRFTVGLSERDPEVGNSTSNLGLGFDLDYAFSPKTTLNLTISNDFDSSSTGGTSQEVLSVGLSGNTQLTNAISVGANVRFDQADYSTGREDEFMVFGVNASYIFNKHISTSLSYSYQDNDSSLVGSSFKANVVALTASFRY